MAAPGMRLTRAGKLLLAKALTGKELKFLRVSIGDGEFDYDSESVFDLTELRNWRMDLPLVECVVQGDGTAYVKAHLSNAEVVEGFAAKEHGVIAQDPDTGEEILFSYRNAGEDYDFVPSNLGPVHKNLDWSYIVEIQDAENVTAVLDLSVAYINSANFKDHVNALHPHPNTPNHYLNISEASHIWAADEDNHLHKLSVANLRGLLRDGVADINSAEDIVRDARAELGLDANMLIIEDFANPDTVDNFKVRVTSSAENGSLLGVENVDGLKTGTVYTISDGINNELVKVVSVVNNISGYHARLENRLSFGYDWNRTHLFRSTSGGADRVALNWAAGGEFKGVEANIGRAINFETTLARAADFDIEGEGVLTVDGFFTLMG